MDKCVPEQTTRSNPKDTDPKTEQKKISVLSDRISKRESNRKINRPSKSRLARLDRRLERHLRYLDEKIAQLRQLIRDRGDDR